MNITIILFIIGIVIAFFLAFKIFRKLLKAAITVFVLIIVILAVVGVVIYNDAIILKQGFEEGKTILITKEDTLITAFKATTDLSLTATIRQEFYEPITNEELQNLKEKLKDNELKEINNSSFILILKHEIFLEEETQILGRETFAESAIFNAFANTNNAEDAILIIEGLDEITQQDVEELQELDINEIKSKIYYELFLHKFKETRGTFLIKEIKNNNIKTNPELLSITVLNIFPESIMKRLTKDD